MNRIELQKELQLKSRQHVDYVLAGKRNLKLWRARLAVLAIGGDIETWMDPDRTPERKTLFMGQEGEPRYDRP